MNGNYDYDKNIIYERTKNMISHKKNLDTIRNRRNIYEEMSKESFSPKKKSSLKQDFNKKFDEAFGNRYLFNRLMTISNKELSPLQCSSLESRIIDQQRRVMKFQSELKEKYLKKENERLYKRVEESAPFMSVKQLDDEFLNEHLHLINNIKKVKRNGNNENLNNLKSGNSLWLPSININNSTGYKRVSMLKEPFQRLDANDQFNYKIFNTET